MQDHQDDDDDDDDDQTEGKRLIWPEHDGLPDSPVYLPHNLDRRVAFWDLKPWRQTLWPKQRSRVL